MSGHLFNSRQILSGEAEGTSRRPPSYAPEAEGVVRSPSRKQTTILIVDDEQLLRSSTMRLLKREGFLFKEANDGVEGLEIFRAGGVDVVLTDLRMPRMGGLELLQRIMADDRNAKVLVASANFSGAERDAVLSHGAYAALDKPYDIGTLKALIDAAVSSPQKGPAGGMKPARILVVDDDPDCRDALAILLGAEGHHVQTAENGLDGLGSFFAGGFDIVVSDLHMPDMNGHEMLREILKGNPKARIIMMSAEARQDELAALEADGAFAVLGKPVDLQTLLNVIGQAVSE